jgi:predicted metal-dependent enzyme (double-stranded beta helix superfamily)
MADGLASVVSAEALPLAPGQSRRYDKLLATEDYDVWLIAWAASGALELHDHGGSIGVVRVVAGELVETYTDLVDRHPLRSATISAGQSVTLPATRVHEIWNPGPAPAVSLHVYSPPLASMTFYDDRPGCFLVPRRAEGGASPG